MMERHFGTLEEIIFFYFILVVLGPNVYHASTLDTYIVRKRCEQKIVILFPKCTLK
jgi:hypothetical protein